MKSGWEEKKLGEVCELVTRGVSPKYIEVNGLCVLNQKCVRGHKINYEFSRLHDRSTKPVASERILALGDVLVNSTGTGTLGRVAQVRDTPIPATVDSHVTIVRPKKELFFKEFFGYAMIRIEEEIAENGEGCGGQTELARDTLKNKFEIRYPKSLAEQKRIVAILDEAFAAIAVANANAEKNLQNARELFDSYLQSVFANSGDGWETRHFEDCLEKVIYTNKIQRKDFLEQGEFPIVSQEQEFINGYWNNSSDLFTVSRPVIIFGDHTQILKYVEFDFVLGADGVKVIQPKSIFDSKFFFYFLTNVKFKTLGYARHYRLLKEISVPLPPINEQQSIVAKLDALSIETKKLETIYRQKLADLDELKKSVLQKAFSGNLT